MKKFFLFKKQKNREITRDVLLLLMDKIIPDTPFSAFNGNSIFSKDVQKRFAEDKLFLNLSEKKYISDKSNRLVYASNLTRALKRAERRFHLCKLLIRNKKENFLDKLVNNYNQYLKVSSTKEEQEEVLKEFSKVKNPIPRLK